ncbi:MAG: SDR family NAD(P)-dependent oxidoreductase [Aestuariivita sp.]|nr:SDR family NAD(P)-dependent oxidoreductase [Aestuariivita sp.]MCY4203797.1 SDR family NAD(P)-dependent oxidoreductase [Aestuariivita sp.]MCY4288411.1 SDR family NAD(P)-dependent oxidoreductase [Aestuariivita sp.]MCY4345901.1 SDR family NAD(P)-dependent oxidoreductase [Aestuariivita sp.]
MEQPLKNKIALVAGATGGIGQATAKRLAEDGAMVMAAGRSETKLRDVATFNDNITTQVADVAKERDVAALVMSALEKFGRLDIVFNGAGITGDSALMEYQTIENFQTVMNINVTGTFLVLKHTIPALRHSGGGSIINIGSAASVQAARDTMPVYCASKHAVVGLTRVMAKSYGRENIRTNVICPGQIDTEMVTVVEQAMIDPSVTEPTQQDIEVAREKVLASIPVGRYGTVDEVAAVVAFLSRDEASFINGSIYTIDGGLTPT